MIICNIVNWLGLPKNQNNGKDVFYQPCMLRKYFLMNKLSRKVLLIIIYVTIAGCTVSNEYGPYRGKVVDAETGQPIKGAVVFVRFDTLDYGGLGGTNSEYIDSVEVLTNENGEFSIPVHKIKAFKILHRWDPYETGFIFQPGYGVYPKHPEVSRDYPELEHIFPENFHVTFKLPKLKTVEERKMNLHNIYVPSSVPYNKQKLLLEKINIENKVVLPVHPGERKRIRRN